MSFIYLFLTPDVALFSLENMLVQYLSSYVQQLIKQRHICEDFLTGLVKLLSTLHTISFAHYTLKVTANENYEK